MDALYTFIESNQMIYTTDYWVADSEFWDEFNEYFNLLDIAHEHNQRPLFVMDVIHLLNRIKKDGEIKLGEKEIQKNDTIYFYVKYDALKENVFMKCKYLITRESKKVLFYHLEVIDVDEYLDAISYGSHVIKEE